MTVMSGSTPVKVCFVDNIYSKKKTMSYHHQSLNTLVYTYTEIIIEMERRTFSCIVGGGGNDAMAVLR
jgi:hypothetical protein